MKAFAYLRVSTDRQEVEAQRSQAAAFAAYRGYELLTIPDEIDVSGSVPFAKRPVGAEILRRLDECDAVIFPKVDRGFRDTVDAMMTVAALRADGKDIHFLDMALDTTTPAGELCFTMMAAFAAFERRRIGERIREKMAEKAKDPNWRPGPAGFGHRNRARIVDGRKIDGGLHEPVEAEAGALALIRSMRSRPLREIVTALESAKIQTRRGGQWHPYTVSKVLRRMA
jgi:DNA invertase Pin-like site-specific DNA recombinase